MCCRPNFCEILRVPHLPQVSCRYLVLGKFQSQTSASDAALFPILPPSLYSIFFSPPYLSITAPPSPQIWIRYSIGGGHRYGSGGGRPPCWLMTLSKGPPNTIFPTRRRRQWRWGAAARNKTTISDLQLTRTILSQDILLHAELKKDPPPLCFKPSLTPMTTASTNIRASRPSGGWGRQGR